MKYIFSLTAAHAQINHMLPEHEVPIEFSVFSDIILNYVQSTVRRWYFGLDYTKNINMLRVGLNHYLTLNDVDSYLMYLDNIFWPNINNAIDEDVFENTMVFITILSDGSLMIEIKPEKTPLQIIIDRVCIDVEHKLYSGEYVDPTLQEIYHASRTTV